MTSANNQIITRCPKCGTAFRVTPSQLQSAKGAVRCGSCLHVFKAQEYLVATPIGPAKASALQAAASTSPTSELKKPEPAKTELRKAETSKSELTRQPSSSPTAAAKGTEAIKTAQVGTSTLAEKAAKQQTSSINKPAPVAQGEPAILSAIKPLAIETPKAVTTEKPAVKPPAKPVIRTINKSSLKQTDDILISDDMEDEKTDKITYDFDGFVDIDATPKSEVSLFERKIREKDDDEDSVNTADESWAEMLIEDEEDDTPKLRVLKPKTDEQLADEALAASAAQNSDPHTKVASVTSSPAATTTPGLVFSLIGEKEEPDNQQESDDFILSDELARIPSNQGFKQPQTSDALDPSLFETPEENEHEETDNPKRQVKTQPKIRSYDGSRTALLMNIIPAPIEFNAKRMRRWYQRKLWPSLSIIGLIALVIQVGWFKFDYFSRVEPYRTGYLFLCPYLGCKVPTLIDTSRILASNLVVREHPDTQGALAVDVMLINSAPFEQPFPDLVLVFTDINENQVAARRFTPKDYLGGELVGKELMPQNQKIHITLDLVDPGSEAVNYHISIAK